jgi:hypothetical protein
VSGGLNGILVYEWQSRLKPNVTKWFDVANDPNKKQLPPQFITQISFNPNKQDQICGSGPNGNLAYFGFGNE